MATKIITKTGSGAPTTSEVDRGELAVDLTNKQLYTNDGSSIIKLGSGSGEGQWSLASNGDDIYYDKGDVMVGNKLTAGGLLVNGTDSFIKCELDHEGTGTQIWQTTTNFAIYPNGESSKGFTINNATGNVDVAQTAAASDSVGVTIAERAYFGYDGARNVAVMSDNGNLKSLVFDTNGAERLRIDASNGNATFNGNVGIGMAPTRSTFDLSAKEQLAQWKAKAKKASWPIVTDDAFDQEPTEDLVAQWIETRAAGDRLQVEGNGSFSGTVNAGDVTIGGLSVYNSSAGGCGLRFTTGNQIRPASNTGAAATTGTISIGDNQSKFKDAYFSGTIYGDVDGAFLRAETIVQDGAPVVDSLQIIRAFMKLRDAVDDPDSSVEELRDKLKVAVVDIIDQFQDLVDSVEPDRER